MFSPLFETHAYPPVPVRQYSGSHKRKQNPNFVHNDTDTNHNYSSLDLYGTTQPETKNIGEEDVFIDNNDDNDDDDEEDHLLSYFSSDITQQPVLRCPSNQFFQSAPGYSTTNTLVREEGEENDNKTMSEIEDNMLLNPLLLLPDFNKADNVFTEQSSFATSPVEALLPPFALYSQQTRNVEEEQYDKKEDEHHSQKVYNVYNDGFPNEPIKQRMEKQQQQLLLPVTKPMKTKKRPTTLKARQMYEQKKVYNQFSKEIPILTTRPFLRNGDNLFGNIMVLIDACIVEMLFPKESNLETSSDHNTFLQFFNEAIFMNNQNMDSRGHEFDLAWRSSHKPYFFAFLSLERNQNNILSVYYNRHENKLLVVDFDTGVPDATVTEQSLMKQGVLWSKYLFRPSIQIKRIPWITPKYMAHGFDMATNCKKKIWHTILLLLVAKHKEHPQKVLDMFFCPETTDDTICWLHSLFSQSLLYYALEHKEALCMRLKKFRSRQQPLVDKLFKSIQTQCGIKPIVSATHGSKRKNKNGASRIGKFKGRQTEQTFCVIVNGNIGVHATFEKLCTTNMFSLLLQASTMTNESEFNYEDLCSCLPHFFGKNKAELFPSDFELKSPYMVTRDPMKCFGPILSTLWPLVKTSDVRRKIENLVALNDKKWKLEFEICLIQGEKPQNNNVIMSRFISQMALCAQQPQPPYPLHEYVSIIDETTKAPLLGGFYYHDPDYDLELAKQQLNMHETCKITQYQEVCKVPHKGFSFVMEEEQQGEEEGHEINNDNKKQLLPQQQQQCQIMYFRRDPLHGIWKGSRIVGIAVRRFFGQTSKMLIQTFPNVETFQNAIKTDRHFFLPLPSKQSFHHPPVSLNDGTTQQTVLTCSDVVQMYLKLPEGRSLLCVDDIGLPKIVLCGNIPFLASSSSKQDNAVAAHVCAFYDCASCLVCPKGDDDFKWVKMLLHAERNATTVLPWTTTDLLPGKSHSCLLFKNETSILLSSGVVCNGANQNVPIKDELIAFSQRKVQALYYIGAVRNHQIEYLNSFLELQTKVYKHIFNYVMTQQQRCGVLQFMQRDSFLFEAQITQRCSCCRQGSVCVNALGICVLLTGVASSYRIQTVYSNLELLKGKTISFDFLEHTHVSHLPFGLRCKHDWRQGITSLKVEATVQCSTKMSSSNNHNKSDALLLTSQKTPIAIYGHRTLRLIV